MVLLSLEDASANHVHVIVSGAGGFVSRYQRIVQVESFFGSEGISFQIPNRHMCLAGKDCMRRWDRFFDVVVAQEARGIGNTFVAALEVLGFGKGTQELAAEEQERCNVNGRDLHGGDDD